MNFFWLTFLWLNAWRNLKRHARRTLVTVLSVAAAAAAILVFESFKKSLIKTARQSVITSYYGHYELTKKGFYEEKSEKPYGYQIVDFDLLREKINSQVGELKFFSRRQEFFGLLNFSDRSFGGVGIAIDAAEDRKFLTLTQVAQGKHLADSPKDSVFIGTGVAKALHVGVGDVVALLVTTPTGSLNALDLNVTGIFKTGVVEIDDRGFYVHQSLVQSLLKIPGAPRILIGFEKDDELQFKKPLEDLLTREFSDLKASHWMERAPFYENLLGWMTKQIFVFYIIVLIIATLGIANVFTMGLLERVGEFGTLKSLGNHASEIAMLIFVEAILQAFLGSILGIVLGIFIILVPLGGGILMPPPALMSVPMLVQFAVPLKALVPIALICTVVSGLSGIFPAIKFARMSIVKALGRNI